VRIKRTAHLGPLGRVSARQGDLEPVSGFEPLTVRLQGRSTLVVICRNACPSWFARRPAAARCRSFRLPSGTERARRWVQSSEGAKMFRSLKDLGPELDGFPFQIDPCPWRFGERTSPGTA
jgi:hypothetical protein